MAPSVVLAPEIFDFFAFERLANDDCNFHLLAVFWLWAMMGAFDKQAQFMPDAVESSLVGAKSEKGGVGCSVIQHHRGVICAIVPI